MCHKVYKIEMIFDFFMAPQKTSSAFFPSARTTKTLHEEVKSVLSELGLSWGAFVNNAARKLVQEKKVTFEYRDENSFTASKAEELKNAMKDIKRGNSKGKMSLSEGIDSLSPLT